MKATSGLLLLLSLPIALASSISAGDVRHVGVGQPFATVQAAVDASFAGDLVLVDPGTYPAFSVSKGISIVAAGASFTVLTAPGVPAIRVQNLASGRSLSILGARIHYAETGAPAVRVSSNLGAVRFSRLEVFLDANLGSAPVRAAVEIEATKTFWLVDSAVWSDVPRSGSSTVPTGDNDGISGIEFWNSDGVLQNVQVRGYDNPGNRAGDALRIRDDSTVGLRDELLRSAPGGRYVAGNGGLFGGHCLHTIFTNKQARVSMCPGVGFSPGTGTTRNGGYYGINNNSGIRTVSGLETYRYPDQCALPQVVENALAFDVVQIGGGFSVRLYSQATGNYVTMLTARSRFQRVLSGFYGHPLVDLSSRVSVVLSSGVVKASVIRYIDVFVPAVPELAGFQLAIQTALFPPNGLDTISAPALAVIIP